MSTVLQGLVVKDLSGFYSVEVEDGRIIVCRLRGRLMEEAQSSDIAAIGDRVSIQLLEDGTGTIEAVMERASILSRAVRTEGNRGAGQPEREQVIIANADQAFFVFAASQPTPNLRYIDRFLVAGEKAGIEQLVLVLNKIDLDTDGSVRAELGAYEKIGYTVLHTCALSGQGIERLREMLTNRLSVFTGPSGVGKTSLLNTVQPGLGRRVKEVSGYSKEGMHTTRDSELVKLEFGGYLADTPGLRQLTVWDIEPEELDAYFIEIAPLVPRCRFNDCTHHHEPGCAVRAALAAGELSQSRYASYIAMRDELEAAYIY